MSLKDFFNREVVNSKTAEKIGYVSDFEIDEKSGLIEAIIVPKRKGIPAIFKKSEYVIPWRNIEIMGEEIILVKIDEEGN